MDPLGRARRARARLGEVLLGWEGHSEERGSRYRLVASRYRDATVRLRQDARWWRSRLGPGRTLERIGICELGSQLFRDVDADQWRVAALGCGDRLCPLCLRARAGRAHAQWGPVISAAADDGAPIYHLTLTQRAIREVGGATTAAERAAGWVGPALEDGGDHQVVGGECLADAHERLRCSLRALRQDRATRAVAQHELGGYLLGLEWTGRSAACGIPRWHCHAHILAIAPQGRDPDALLRAWTRRTGADLAAQHVAPVSGASAGLAEVLKYPFKAAQCSAAQLCASIGHSAGRRLYGVGGALHAASAASRTDPWRRWLAERPPRDARSSWVRLLWRELGATGSDPWHAATSWDLPRVRSAWCLEGQRADPWEAEPDEYRALLAGSVLADPIVDDGGLV